MGGTRLLVRTWQLWVLLAGGGVLAKMYAQNVGIGEPNPLAKLHVKYNSALGWGFRLDNQATGNYLRIRALSNEIHLETNTSWFRLDANGASPAGIIVGNSTADGRIRFYSSLEPNANAGNPGEVLTSQGAGAAPVWKPGFGSGTQSVSLSATITKTAAGWSDILTLTVTPQHNKIIIFASFTARLTDNSGMAQFGQAIVMGRILVNGVPIAYASSVITDFDEDFWGGDWVVTSGQVAFAGIPYTVVPGNTYTIKLQWNISVLWASSPWQVRIAPGVSGDHAVLTVFK